MPDEKLSIISSFHVKGGCGKTTVLTSLAMHMAYEGDDVAAADLDLQGSMSTTLLGDREAKRHPPKEREKYLEGFAFKNAKTREADINQRLRVAHYPIQMFSQDKYSSPHHMTEFAGVIEASGISTLLIDTPPADLSERDIRPYQALAHLAASYTFLIVTRPIEKEIIDGIENYKTIESELVELGIESSRIR